MFKAETIYTIQSFGIINNKISDSELMPVQNRTLYKTCCQDSTFKEETLKLFRQSVKYLSKYQIRKTEITKCLIPLIIRFYNRHLTKLDVLYLKNNNVATDEAIYDIIIKELYDLSFKDNFDNNLSFDDYFLMLIWSIDSVLSKFTFTELDRFTKFNSTIIWKLHKSFM